jgi:hypothetical protein
MERARRLNLPALGSMPSAQRVTAYNRIFGTWIAGVVSVLESGERARNAVAVLLAHTGAEVSWGGGLYGWNVGNLVGRSRDWFVMSDAHPETQPDGSIRMVAHSARFGWWATPAAGIGAYVSLVHGHYPEAWARACAGDPWFLPALRAGGYFSGYPVAHPGETGERFDTNAELAARFGPLVRRARRELDAQAPSLAWLLAPVLGASAGLVVAFWPEVVALWHRRSKRS